MRDHLMGYAPAMDEDFREPNGHDFDLCIVRWPCGLPVRVSEAGARCWAESLRRHREQLLRYVRVDDKCMTHGDEQGLLLNQSMQGLGLCLR